jgi:phage baseplate assembly protein W
MAYNVININPLDLQPSKGVGIKVPFDGPTGLNITYTTKDAIKSNILNFFLTGKRERIMNPIFGAGIREQLFEQITPNTLSALEIKLINDLRKYFPSVRIDQLTLSPIYEENAIQLVMVYSVLNNATQTIQITL